MTLSSIYYRAELETKVALLASQMCGDIDEHIFKNLKNKVEGRIIDAGMVIRINKILDYSHGVIGNINFMGSANHMVKYECYMCSPSIDSEFICKIVNFVNGYIICENGPITAVIPGNSIDKHKFAVDGSNITHIDSKKILANDDHLRVSVINIKQNSGNRKMVVMANLMDLATNNDIKMFNQDESIITGGDDEEIDSNDFI